jgi:hypothetical protein
MFVAGEIIRDMQHERRNGQLQGNRLFCWHAWLGSSLAPKKTNDEKFVGDDNITWPCYRTVLIALLADNGLKQLTDGLIFYISCYVVGCMACAAIN